MMVRMKYMVRFHFNGADTISFACSVLIYLEVLNILLDIFFSKPRNKREHGWMYPQKKHVSCEIGAVCIINSIPYLSKVSDLASKKKYPYKCLGPWPEAMPYILLGGVVYRR